MKKIKLVLNLFIAIVALNIQAQNTPNSIANTVVNNNDAPIMTFEKDIHDWGKINEGDIVEADFKFTNTGKSPLLITRIKGSCGCTIPSNWSKEPIMPGESSSFHVKFNSKNKPNKQLKTISITCNTTKGRESVKIKAFVVPNLEFAKLREERKKAYAKKRLEKNKIDQKLDVIKKKEVKPDVIIKEKEIKTTPKKSLTKEKKQSEEKIKKAKKKTKSKLNKIGKDAKRAKKKTKKLEKASKKLSKLQSKITAREKRINNNEFKITKLKRKLKLKTGRGTLSPVSIVKKENKIKSAENKLFKEKQKLIKLKRKL